MQNINFYDRSLRLRRDWLGAPMALAALLVAASLVAAAAAALHWQARTLRGPADAVTAALHDEQAALQALARKIAAMRPDAALEQRLVAMQRTLDRHQAALQMLRDGGLHRESGYAPALQALARQSIDGLWLTALALDRDNMALHGRSLRPELITAYVERLRLEPALQGHTFRALDVRRPPAERTPAPGTAPVTTPDAAPTTPARAPYVEFSLTGTGAQVTASAGGRP